MKSREQILQDLNFEAFLKRKHKELGEPFASFDIWLDMLTNRGLFNLGDEYAEEELEKLFKQL